MGKHHQTVFRRKDQGKEYPKIGLPDSVRPGDYLTFFIDNAYHTREVASVHKGYVMTKPMVLTWGDGTEHLLHKGRKVPWADMDSATRPVPDNATAAPTTPFIPDPDPEPEPETKPVRKRTRTPKAPAPAPPLPAPAPPKPEKPLKPPKPPKAKPVSPPPVEPSPPVKKAKKAKTAAALDLWASLNED